MPFLTGVNAVKYVCTREEIKIDHDYCLGQYKIFVVHITSCTQAKKSIHMMFGKDQWNLIYLHLLT